MKVCFLSSLHPCHDKRVHYKEALTLLAAGHEVYHVCPGEEAVGVLDGVKVLSFDGRRNVMGRLAQLRRLYRLGKSVPADVYHCNEIESWLVGLMLKARTGARCIFDVHEVYSTNVSERLFPKPLRPVVEWLVRCYFRVLSLFTDVVIFAKESAKKDFPALGGKAATVRNFVELGAGPPVLRMPASGGRVRTIHLGAINKGRGWPQLLDAVGLMNTDLVEVHVVGRFGDGSEKEFLSEVQRRGLQDSVTYKSWVPYEEVPGIVASCDVGLIVFQPVHDNFVNALPHKLFDYMLAGLPVIVPDFAIEVRQIVESADCGLIIDTTRPSNIAEALTKLANSPDLRRRLGENGHEAVLECYNWEQEAVTLRAVYSGLESRFQNE